MFSDLKEVEQTINKNNTRAAKNVKYFGEAIENHNGKIVNKIYIFVFLPKSIRDTLNSLLKNYIKTDRETSCKSLLNVRLTSN